MWIFEGITDYYTDLALLHAGLIDEKFRNPILNAFVRTTLAINHINVRLL